jgi:NAD(P)-dependent dehydrogenase (short-subunit alcohol dehydrogenase family)
MSTWLVTGANRGIGLELARQAAAAGHRVFATARNPSAAADLAALKGHVVPLALETTDEASFIAAKQHIGDVALDVVVANAGEMGPKRQSASDMDFEGFQRVLAVNALGPLRTLQAFLPNLERARGKFAVVSSLMGSIEQGGSHQLAYSASKAAVNRVMRGAAGELKSKGIAIGIYSPGWVRTDMGGSNAQLRVDQSVGGLMKRIGELDLASSGQFINWDGKSLPW